MTVYQNDGGRRSIASSQGLTCLEDKFDVIKEIGDGSFGSVVLARVRPQGSAIARKGSLVCIHCCLHLNQTFCMDLLLTSAAGRNQDDEEDVRFVRPMS